MAAFLIPSSTYYLIVDGWSTFAYGDFEITANLNTCGCTDDADCDDDVFCNGREICEVATCQCLLGPRPCTTYEGFTAPCDEDLNSCPEPDPCFTWIAGAASEDS